jgi:hypothetical protein
MRNKDKQDLKQALDKYFNLFDSTKDLVKTLIKERRNPIEILILLCSRLDALASDSTSEGTPSKQAFMRFVTTYGDNNDLLESVSIGDLYYELAYHRWRLEGTIPKPGRLHRFSRVDDRQHEPATEPGGEGMAELTTTKTRKAGWRLA